MSTSSVMLSFVIVNTMLFWYNLGFLDIAGRCRDLTTIVFMDSVDDRENGTIGGFCKNTAVLEEQCDVENAYCSEKSITCQCKPGYELQLDFSNRNDTVCFEDQYNLSHL